MARTPQYYHHGKSPAAWTGSIVAAVGFTIAAMAAMMGPNWLLVIIGSAIILIAGIAAMIMKVMGLGQP